MNKRANETYVLYQCGTPNPLQAANTETDLPANTKVFEIPLVSVSVTDSNAAGFLVSSKCSLYSKEFTKKRFVLVAVRVQDTAEM